MSFEKFFKSKLEDEVESGLEGFVREMMVDIIKNLKDVCKETWNTAQKQEVVAKPSTSDNMLKAEIAKVANQLCSFTHGIDLDKDIELIKSVEQRLRQLSAI